MKFINKRFSGLFLCMLFLLSYADAMTGAIKPDSRYILVINSYMEANPWANNLVTGVIQYVAGDNSLFVDQVYLDLMLQDTQEELALKEEGLFTRYEKKPEVVVIIGNAAWILLRERIVREWEDVPVILCSGMPYSLPPSKYITKTEVEADDVIPIEKSIRGYNLTVIDGSVHIKKTIELIRQLVPDMKKLAFISDRMYVSAAARYEIKKICAGSFPGLELTLLTEGKITTDMLIDSLFSYDKSVGILFFSWYVKDNMWGNNYLSNNLQKTIGSLASSPVFVLRDIEVSDGNMAGGYFRTMDEYKNKLFVVLDRIMNGIPPRHIPSQQAGRSSAYLNYRNLEAFGLDTSLFPSDAVYYQKPQSFYVKHKWELWIGGGLLLALFLTIFIRLKWIRKRKELQDNELRLLSRYKDIISNMPIIYYRHELTFDKDGRLTGHHLLDMNPPFKEVFLQYQALFSEGAHDVIGLFRSEYVDLCRRVIEGQQTVSFCFYDKYQDKYYDFFVFPATQPNAIDVFGIDVTEKQQGRQLLETTNQKLAVSINVADIMPWKWDLAAGTIVFDSGNSEHPYFPEEVNSVLSESDFFEALHPDHRSRVQEEFARLRRGEIQKFREEYQIFSPLAPEEVYDWVETLAIVYERDKNGEPLSLIGSSRIITKRKEIENDLREAKERADESNLLKSAFLANMSHEIRTPLNAIVGFSGILASAEDPDERKEYVEIIENNNTLLLQLIGDILDLSKIEAGTLEFHYSDVELDGLMKEVEQTSRLRVQGDRVEVVFEQGIPGCKVYTERNRLLQVITNFISNSIKFTKEGSIRFGYKEEAAGTLYFYVTDTGCGIPEDKLDAVFGRFVKLNRFAQGTGLGLSICETIVEKMGGKIGVTSTEGQGSTFWFTLPYEPAHSMPGLQEGGDGRIPLRPAKAGELILLIAEDDPGNYRLFESILKKEYTLIHAWNGREAVELFKKHRPHLVLMDIRMPEMDGYQATEEIRKYSASVPVIAVTAYTFADDEQNIRKNGFDDFAPKPIDGSVLKKKITGLLKERFIFI